MSGTCRIGTASGPAAVVDPELRLHGVAGLRVVDASVFPTLTSVNPVVTVMLVAERATAFYSAGILRQRGLREDSPESL